MHNVALAIPAVATAAAACYRFAFQHSFEIAGGTPGLEVSWQVTGERNDPYCRDHPYQSVQEKTAEERGRYFYPAGYGQPEAMRVGKGEVEIRN